MDDLITSLRRIVGEAHVLSGDDDRTAYDHDWTHEFKGRSLAVVRPGSTAEVSQVLALANATNTTIIPQGGNTGLAGGCFAGTSESAIILNLGRMNKLRSVNAASRTAVAEAGVILDAINASLAEQELVFPMSFGAKGSCTVGGMLSTNAGGSNAVRYGTARANCLGLEVVTATGEVMNVLSELRKDNTGYDLRDLMIGAEGTLGVITAAVVKLAPLPPAYATAMVAMNDIGAALDLLNEAQDRSGNAVEAFEFMPDRYFTRFNKIFPDKPVPLSSPGPVNIMMEIAGRKGDTAEDVEASLLTLLESAMDRGDVTDAVVAQSDRQRKEIWAIREAAYEITFCDGPAKNHDVSLPLDQVGAFLVGAQRIADKHAPGAQIVEVAHLGDGNVHYPVLIDPASDAATALTADIDALVVSLGGSVSAEHGVGLGKKKSMRMAKDPVALTAMRAIKQALDPNGILNPGKVLP